MRRIHFRPVELHSIRVVIATSDILNLFSWFSDSSLAWIWVRSGSSRTRLRLKLVQASSLHDLEDSGTLQPDRQ